MSSTNPLDGMTQEKWNSLSRTQRDMIRDYSDLSPQLSGFEGYRVEVVDTPGDTPRRFIVGRSTGWRPCHIEVARRNSHGGMAASKEYASVRVLYRAKGV